MLYDLLCMYMLMRDAEGKKKQARSNKQQGKATLHTQGSHFPKKKELTWVGFEPTCTFYIYTPDTCIDMYRIDMYRIDMYHVVSCGNTE